MIVKTVDTNRIRQNIIKLKEKSKNAFCAVVKANAYGHGIEICKDIADLVDFFAVANANEALDIKKMHLKNKVLVLGKVDVHDIPKLISKGVRLTVDSIDDVAHIVAMAMAMKKRAYVHIKINSGMNRLGIKDKLQLQNIYSTLKQCKYVKVEGIYTHFATADNKNSYKLKRQNAKFLSMLKAIPQKDLKKIILHASNSSAFLKSNKYAYDMVRVGIAMYGYDQVDKVKTLPALTLKAKIVKVQNIKCGESVGYDAEFVAPRDMTIAVVAIGYADGFARAYKNGFVLIKGTKCKIVGKVCMDMLMCDVTHLCSAQNACQKTNKSSAENISANQHTSTNKNNEKLNTNLNFNEILQNFNDFDAKNTDFDANFLSLENFDNFLDGLENSANCFSKCNQSPDNAEKETDNASPNNIKGSTQSGNATKKQSPSGKAHDSQSSNNTQYGKISNNQKSGNANGSTHSGNAPYKQNENENHYNDDSYINKIESEFYKGSSKAENIFFSDSFGTDKSNTDDDIISKIKTMFANQAPQKLFINEDTIYKLFDSKASASTNAILDILPLGQVLQNLLNTVKESLQELDEIDSTKASTCCHAQSTVHCPSQELVGEWATILGRDGDEQLTARDWAHLSGTIEYEVLTNFNLARL